MIFSLVIHSFFFLECRRVGCSVLVNHQSLFSNFLPLDPIIMSFSIKYRQNRFLLQSSIEVRVLDFMIYQLVNRRTEILAIAISHIAHLRNPYNHVSALLISMPHFNNTNFYQNKPKTKLFLHPKYYVFEQGCRSSLSIGGII